MFYLSKLPFFSYFFAHSFYQQQLNAYDVLINYIEAHRKAQAMIVTIIKQEDLKNIITKTEREIEGETAAEL